MSQARVITGAAVNCYVNGKPFGRVSGFTFQSVTPAKAIYALDSTEPYELAITTTKIHGTVQIYRTLGDGGAEGAGMTTNFEDLPRAKYFSLQLVERSSDTVLFQAELCVVTNQSWSIPAKGSVTGTVEFEAIAWSNEVKPLGSGG